MSKAEKRYRGIYFATVVLGLVSALFMARFSFSLGKVIDVVLDPTESLQKTMSICICMAACWLVVSFIYNYTEIIYVNRIMPSVQGALPQGTAHLSGREKWALFKPVFKGY